jgi:hypothetical protein
MFSISMWLELPAPVPRLEATATGLFQLPLALSVPHTT